MAQIHDKLTVGLSVAMTNLGVYINSLGLNNEKHHVALKSRLLRIDNKLITKIRFKQGKNKNTEPHLWNTETLMQTHKPPHGSSILKWQRFQQDDAPRHTLKIIQGLF